MHPSAPLLLVQWTAAAFPGCRVATETPANLQAVLGAVDAVVRIQRTGGPRALTIDNPSVDVDVFATTLEAADALCGAVTWAWEWDMPGALIDGGSAGRAVVARVGITSGPKQLPVSDTTLFRVGASASIGLHRQA